MFHLCIETLLRLWFWPRLFSWYDIQCFCNFLSKIFPLHCALSKNVNCSLVFAIYVHWNSFEAVILTQKTLSVFLRLQIWIANYYVKYPIKNSQLWKQKSCCFKKNGLYWHFNSHFVLQTTETPVFIFSLLRFFD